jgi:dTDP-glucose pyrophosphorylase
MQKLVDSEQMIKGEYYASLVYNFMVQDGLKVWVPNDLKVFCNWGTPEDLEDYLFWIDVVKQVEHPINIIIPMAGAGQRFVNAGYKNHKPILPITDYKTGDTVPMVVAAVSDLPYVKPRGENVIFIDRSFHKGSAEQSIKSYYPEAKFISLDELTDGQAVTCLKAKSYINNSNELMISACDNGMVFDLLEFDKLRHQTDVIVFTQKNGNVLKNPNAYGWVRVDTENNVVDVSVKRAISDTPEKDNAVVATFWFKRGDIFVKAAEKMIKENDRVNNEFYADQVINHVVQLGYRAKVLVVDKYIGWGTPEDYENYNQNLEYWNEFIKSPAYIDR